MASHAAQSRTGTAFSLEETLLAVAALAAMSGRDLVSKCAA